MAGVVFDTSVVIAHNLTEYPDSFLMSAVVLQELIAGAADKSVVQKWLALYRLCEKENRLLIPDGADWCEAGRVMNAMLRGLKTKSGGKTPKLQGSEKQGIIRDVLIARTVKRAGALLVTDNVKDFQRIRRFCSVRFVSGSEYFE